MALCSEKAEGTVINVASGKVVTIHSIIEIIKQLIGKGNPQYGKVPYRHGENMALFADTHQARKVLAWTPKINLTEGLKRTINWIKKYGD